MDKKIAGVIAAVSAVIPMAAAHASVTPTEVRQAMTANSFAELLQSVPNAAAILEADDQMRAQAQAATPDVQVAWHHHHHHSWWWHHHHHHWYHHHHHHHWW